MGLILEGLTQGLKMIFAWDAEVMRVAWLTIRVSAAGTAIAVVIGVPFGAALALARFRGRGLLIAVVNVGMALPPVVAGLLVTIALWRTGPLGWLRLLYTPTAMVIAQGLIATPWVTALTRSTIEGLGSELREQLSSIGASRLQILTTLLAEGRLGLLAAVMAGFGRVVGEVGAATMVGGNIPGHTRVLSTAIVLEVSRGNFGLAIALSLILMLLAFGATAILTSYQQRGLHR